MRAFYIATLALLALTACEDNFVPAPKVSTYDPVTGAINPPHPCPDWSQSGTYNYLNQVDSNFGCAVNKNDALQLAYPQDLIQGHGDNRPDTGISTGVIENYRAGKIPLELKPLEDVGSGGASSQ